MARRIPVVFLNRYSRRNMGSSVMRVDQLSAHLAAHFGDRYRVSTQYVSNKAKAFQALKLAVRNPNAVYVFSKNAAWGWSGADMRRLRRSARAILVDYVDMPITEMIPHGVDCHLSTTYAGLSKQKEWVEQSAAQGIQIDGQHAPVLHNYDTALDQLPPPLPMDEFRMAFFGTPALFPHSPLADRHATLLDGSSPQTFQASLAQIMQFNAHLCVRVGERIDGKWVVKPATKLATAAACGAVVLADRKTPDAVHHLGADYPFLIDDSQPATIDAGLTAMMAAFGTETWALARHRVDAMRANFSHATIAAQLHDAIQSCLVSGV